MIKSKIKIRNRFVPKGMKILYEDRDFIIINKSAKLLSVSTETEKEKTALALLTNYVRKGNAKARITLFPVHRLDYDTSGLLIFAKSREIREKFVSQWTEVKKKYLTLIHGHFKKKSDIIESYLTENENFKVYSVKNPQDGKLARTQYTVLKESEEYSLLEIDLLTGKKNQIRVHMLESGHPIYGDTKYGDSKKKRLALHALSIRFRHPFSNEEMFFETAKPDFVDICR